MLLLDRIILQFAGILEKYAPVFVRSFWITPLVTRSNQFGDLLVGIG